MLCRAAYLNRLKERTALSLLLARGKGGPYRLGPGQSPVGNRPQNDAQARHLALDAGTALQSGRRYVKRFPELRHSIIRKEVFCW